MMSHVYSLFYYDNDSNTIEIVLPEIVRHVKRNDSVGWTMMAIAVAVVQPGASMTIRC